MTGSVVMVVVGVDADATGVGGFRICVGGGNVRFGVRKCGFSTLKFNCHGFSARIKQKTRNTRQNQTYQVKPGKTRKTGKSRMRAAQHMQLVEEVFALGTRKCVLAVIKFNLASNFRYA
jgi:hypothetical protein